MRSPPPAVRRRVLRRLAAGAATPSTSHVRDRRAHPRQEPPLEDLAQGRRRDRRASRTRSRRGQGGSPHLGSIRRRGRPHSPRRTPEGL